MLLRCFFSDCACEVNEDMYNKANSQLSLLAELEVLSKQLAESTRVQENANPIRALRCHLWGEGHTNGYCVSYIK